MKRDLQALQDGAFDVLIIGSGITGAGVALDASLRGLRVALIDKGDFGSGTSSVSSKLVHGGLRYLEHGDFRLVYEALHERRLLIRNAPHLVHPLRFVVPFYQGSRVAPWKCRLGLTLYDLLAGTSNIARSRPITRRRLQRDYPALQKESLLGGAAYFDAQTDDARLCLEVVRTAAKEGACVANYLEAVAFEHKGGVVTGVRARDHSGGQELAIRARLCLNATGPWVDAVCRLAGDLVDTHLEPTKGVHLLAPDRGLTSAFLLLHPTDGRVFFVIPWMRKTLLGTTDTRCDESPDALTVTPQERDYLLAGHNYYLRPPLTASDLLGEFAGIRPLVRAGRSAPSSISREFQVFTTASGLISVAGGKYTTYRHMAEAITDRIIERLGRHRTCRTRTHSLDGSPGTPWGQFEAEETIRLERNYGLSAEQARHLVHRYGRHAQTVAEYAKRDPDMARPIVPGEPDLLAELPYQREHEMALYPADHVLRRTRLGLNRTHDFTVVERFTLR